MQWLEAIFDVVTMKWARERARRSLVGLARQTTDTTDFDVIHHHLSCKRLGWPVAYTQLYVDGHRLNEIKTMVVPLINLAIAIAIIASMAFLSEFIIRRR